MTLSAERPLNHVVLAPNPRVPLVDTNHRPARTPAALGAAACILALVILAAALLSFGSPSASGLSPQLGDAPPGRGRRRA